MQKQKKHILKPERIPAASWLTMAAVAAVLTAVALLGSFTEIPLGVLCLAAFVLIIAAAVTIVLLTDHRNAHGTDSQVLSPVLGNIMLDTVMKQASPVFICDEAERIIWYNKAFAAATEEKTQLYGRRVSEFMSRDAASVREEAAPDGSAVTVGERSCRALAYALKAKDDAADQAPAPHAEDDSDLPF